MNHVKACLQRAGLTAAGSPVPPIAQRAYPNTPIATVMITGANTPPTAPSLIPASSQADARPTTVTFYLTTGQARRAYARFLPTVAKQGQGVGRQGRVLYTWNNQPTSQATTERRCVQAG